MNSLRKSKYASTKNSKFHVNLPGTEFQERGVDVPPPVEEEITEPDLFPGEVVIATANNVLKYSPRCGHNTGISGTLYITNLRLTLHTTLPASHQEQYLHHHNLNHIFLGPHDVELTLISTVGLLDEQNQHRKTLTLGNALPERIHGIQLVLKNFRLVNLSFKFSPPGEDIKVLTALLHHSNPASVDLLFFSPGTTPPPHYIPSFRTHIDWQSELERTSCPGWRVTHHNEHYNLCATFPPALVVPAPLLDAELEKAGHQFREGRALVWLWGCAGGAALVIMAQVSPNIPDTSVENSLIRAVHRSHPRGIDPHIYDLDREMPQPLELYNALDRLRRLHVPEVVSSSYHSRFESSKWLTYVSTALRIAKDAAGYITECNKTVILQEGSGRDTSLIVSSLVEIICDPFARTIRGLHSLIAKHWVAVGHPFTTRLGHTRANKHLQGPCFLLFLDCVHQLCTQQPHLLEYTVLYLSAIWGAAHSSLYSTCFFDSTNSRHSTLSFLSREKITPSIELWDIWSWWSECESSEEKTPQKKNKELLRKCSTSCSIARKSFISPLYVHQLFVSLLSSLGAVDRIHDPMSIAHHTWQQIKRLLYPHSSSHLPYDTSLPPIYPPLTACTPHHPRRGELPPPLSLEHKISKLSLWVTLFGQWLPEEIICDVTQVDSSSTRKVSLPDSPELLFWPTIYEMYETLNRYLSSKEVTTNGVKGGQ